MNKDVHIVFAPATAREKDLGRILTATEKLDDKQLRKLRWIAENMPDLAQRCATITAAGAEPALTKNTYTSTPREHVALGNLRGLNTGVHQPGRASPAWWRRS